MGDYLDTLDPASIKRLHDQIIKKIPDDESSPAAQSLDSMSADQIRELHNNIITNKQVGSQGEAALQGFGKGASLGYLPQMQAGTEVAIDKIAKLLGVGQYTADQKLKDQGFTINQNEPTYLSARDQYIQKQNELEKAYPKTFKGSEIAGSIAGTAPLALVGGAPATTAQAIKLGAGMGAAQGIVQNPGDIQGEINPLQLGERLKGGAIGGVTGGITGGILGKIFTPGGNAATQETANELGFRSLGPYAKEARNALRKGEVQDIGQAAISSGIVRKMPGTAETIAERAGTAANLAGEQKGSIIEKLSEFENRAAQEMAGGAPSLPGQKIGAGVDRKMLADEMESNLLLPKEVADQSSILQNNNLKLKQFVDEFRSVGDPLIPLKSADKIKTAIGKEINWNKPMADRTLEERALVAQYNALNKGVDSAAEAIATKYDNEILGGAAKALKDSKKSYHLLKTASDIANNKEARELGKRLISPSDNAAIATGVIGALASGGGTLKIAVLGALSGAANNLGRRFGPQVGAKFLDAVAKGTKDINLAPQAIEALNQLPMVLGSPYYKKQTRLKALGE